MSNSTSVGALVRCRCSANQVGPISITPSSGRMSTVMHFRARAGQLGVRHQAEYTKATTPAIKHRLSSKRKRSKGVMSRV